MVNQQQSNGTDAARDARTVVVTGGTDGMGRALVLGRAARGDLVISVGSNRAKGERLLADAKESGLDGRIEFLAADLSTIAGNQTVIEHVNATYGSIDALVLAANRQCPERIETNDGYESTFALYYVSRYLLGHGLQPALVGSGRRPVIVNIAGVGLTSGQIHWEDLQLHDRYRTITAQLQAGRANDLLGVAMGEQFGQQVSYVLYHPGFTRSGDSAMEQISPIMRALVKVIARVAARPVQRAIAPVHDFIDTPPTVPLTAIDRGKPVPLDLKTLDHAAARRLADVTAQLVGTDPRATRRGDVK